MEEQNLVTLNQESLVIVIQVLDVLEKIQKNFQLINKTTDTQKEVVTVLQKLGKNCYSLEELMPMLIAWTGKLRTEPGVTQLPKDAQNKN